MDGLSFVCLDPAFHLLAGALGNTFTRAHWERSTVRASSKQQRASRSS